MNGNHLMDLNRNNIKYYDLLVCAYRMGFEEIEASVLYYATWSGISGRIAAHDMKYEGDR